MRFLSALQQAGLSRYIPVTGALALVFTGVFVLSACTEQHASTKGADSALLTAPAMDERLIAEDFDFPSKPPSLMRGREVFQQHCVKCHAPSFWQGQKVKEDLAYSTPIDTYLFLTTGKAPDVTLSTKQRKEVLPKQHPELQGDLSRDDRWAVIFYTRYLAGAGDIKPPRAGAPDVAAIFGGNCAVCHGTRGRADGPLYIAKTGNHELHDGDILHNLIPPPADFRQYDRMYNRTDAQLFKYICQGVYPSAMPAWYGNVERDKDTGKVVFVFDDNLIWSLVRHVRLLSYDYDLDPALPEAKNPPAGLHQLQSCGALPTNKPWTKIMRENAPGGFSEKNYPAADPVIGGMTFNSRHEAAEGPGKAHGYPLQKQKSERHGGEE